MFVCRLCTCHGCIYIVTSRALDSLILAYGEGEYIRMDVGIKLLPAVGVSLLPRHIHSSCSTVMIVSGREKSEELGQSEIILYMYH